MEDLAEATGVPKATLYYHFAGKEEIVRSLFAQRGDEAEELLEWVVRQPQTIDLVKAAVLRWVGSFSADKLHGLRFLSANPLLVRSLAAQGDNRIGSALAALIDALVALLPHRTVADTLQLRMALLSINAAVEASAQGDFTDEEIVAAAHRSAAVLVDALVERD